jgi:hypothetical protein
MKIRVYHILLQLVRSECRDDGLLRQATIINIAGTKARFLR